MAGTYYTSPKGTAAYPRLNKPDMKYAKDKKNEDGSVTKGKGKFKTGLILADGPAQEFIEEITDFAKEELSKKQLEKVVWPYKKLDDGTYRFDASSEYKVGIADSKGKLVNEPEKLSIGSGSIIKIKGQLKYVPVDDKHYIKLYLNSVQLLKYVEYQGNGGFEEDDSEGDEGYVEGGGFSADDANADAGSDKPKGDATNF